MIYLICFIISCILISLGNKKKRKIIVYIGLILPCILAGLRNYTIGTDVQVYVKPLVEIAQNKDNFVEFFNSRWWYVWCFKYVSQFEIGYIMFVYVIVKIFNSLQMVLFFTQTIISIFMYKAIIKYKDIEGKEWLAMLVYYLLFYNIGLNAMRQFISISILFYGFSLLINDHNRIKFIVLFILAFLFHKSSILGLIIWGGYELFENKYIKNNKIVLNGKSVNGKKIILMLIILLFSFFVINNSLFIKFLNLLGMDNYSGYITGNIKVGMISVVKILPFIILLLFNWSEVKRKKNVYVYLYIFLCFFIFSQYASVSSFGARVAFLFETFNLILYPTICCTENNKSINYVLLISYLLFYWWFYFIHGGANQTYPYIFYFN